MTGILEGSSFLDWLDESDTHLRGSADKSSSPVSPSLWSRMSSTFWTSEESMPLASEPLDQQHNTLEIPGERQHVEQQAEQEVEQEVGQQMEHEAEHEAGQQVEQQVGQQVELLPSSQLHGHSTGRADRVSDGVDSAVVALEQQNTVSRQQMKAAQAQHQKGLTEAVQTMQQPVAGVEEWKSELKQRAQQAYLEHQQATAQAVDKAKKHIALLEDDMQKQAERAGKNAEEAIKEAAQLRELNMALRKQNERVVKQLVALEVDCHGVTQSEHKVAELEGAREEVGMDQEALDSVDLMLQEDCRVLELRRELGAAKARIAELEAAQDELGAAKARIAELEAAQDELGAAKARIAELEAARDGLVLEVEVLQLKLSEMQLEKEVQMESLGSADELQLNSLNQQAAHLGVQMLAAHRKMGQMVDVAECIAEL